jgi:hypothetical protein
MKRKPAALLKPDLEVSFKEATLPLIEGVGASS